jgi:beta-lactam-binding protein with PASTA domain
MFKFITGKPLWINVLTALLLAIGVFFVFVLSLRWITHHGSSKTVPDVVGKNFEEAKSMLEDLGFEVVIQDSVYQDTLPRHAIIRQVPGGDAVVKVNRNIYLTINRMVPPVVDMPSLTGYSFRNAQMILANLGLRLKDTLYRPDFARNSVLDQLYEGKSVPPGTKVRMGTEISLVLGSGVGANNFLVPELRGYTYLQAKAILEANGLLVIPYLTDPTITDTMNAFVVRQDPPRVDDEGVPQKIRSGQMLTLFLGREKPVLDSLQGQDEELPD